MPRRAIWGARLLALAGFLGLWPIGVIQPADANAGKPPSPLELLGPNDALLVADPRGRILLKQNASLPEPPASTLKILTALSAIERLGGAHRFKTEFFLAPDGRLKVKGYGDPLFTSETISQAADAVAGLIRHADGISIDDGFFSRDIQIPGTGPSTNPYDAPVGALCANFNTVFFKRDPRGRIVSAEPQTPLVPIAVQRIVESGLQEGRHVLFRTSRECALYAGQLLAHFLELKGVPVGADIEIEPVFAWDRHIYTYRSPFPLFEVLRRMLEFSNNFVANQLLLHMGASAYGPPATLEKGVRVLARLCREELGLRDVKIAEGSGISRSNRLTALDMLAVLRRFRPYRGLLKRDGEILYKSGTLEGVRTRVGYVERGSGGPHLFVIFLRGKTGNVERILSGILELISREDNESRNASREANGHSDAGVSAPAW